jgi:hypothetical protein
MEWHNPQLPWKKNSENQQQAKVVFWDCERVILVDGMPTG